MNQAVGATEDGRAGIVGEDDAMTVFGGAGVKWPVEAGMGADGGGKHFAASVGERVGDGKRRGFDGVGDGESEGEGIDGAGLLIVGEFERAARAGALGPVKLFVGREAVDAEFVSAAVQAGPPSSTRRPMIGKSVGPWRIQGPVRLPDVFQV